MKNEAWASVSKLALTATAATAVVSTVAEVAVEQTGMALVGWKAALPLMYSVRVERREDQAAEASHQATMKRQQEGGQWRQ